MTSSVSRELKGLIDECEGSRGRSQTHLQSLETWHIHRHYSNVVKELSIISITGQDHCQAVDLNHFGSLSKRVPHRLQCRKSDSEQYRHMSMTCNYKLVGEGVGREGGLGIEGVEEGLEVVAGWSVGMMGERLTSGRSTATPGRSHHDSRTFYHDIRRSTMTSGRSTMTLRTFHHDAGAFHHDTARSTMTPDGGGKNFGVGRGRIGSFGVGVGGIWGCSRDGVWVWEGVCICSGGGGGYGIVAGMECGQKTWKKDHDRESVVLLSERTQEEKSSKEENIFSNPAPQLQPPILPTPKMHPLPIPLTTPTIHPGYNPISPKIVKKEVMVERPGVMVERVMMELTAVMVERSEFMREKNLLDKRLRQLEDDLPREKQKTKDITVEKNHLEKRLRQLEDDLPREKQKTKDITREKKLLEKSLHQLEDHLLSEKEINKNIMLRYENGQVQTDGIITFMDFTWPDQVRRRVHMKMIGNTARAIQHLLLCTGLLGHSYIGLTFFKKGKIGEDLIIDAYDGKRAAPLLEDVTVNDGAGRKAKAGDVTGAGFDGADFNTGLFGVYLKDDPGKTDRKVFAQVISGLDILQDIAMSKRKQDIKIVECGISS
ncbi:unnamed protein product, partial [Meganyctiphanes norvegica]